MASRLKRDAGMAWLEKTNPLRGLSIREAQSIFDAARNGDTQRLHWIFQEIEGANPTLMTCVERRTSALAGLDYGVTVRPAADQTLGDEQKDAVERFIADIENFDEMLEHLDLAFFRGFAYAQPLWEADGTVRLVSLLDSWQFLTKDGELYFNPVCDGFTKNAELVTREAGLIGLKRRRSIDYPALSIHIREAVGERDWGRFLERIALPKPAITMAPNSTEKDRAAYVQAAEETEDGKSSVWPNGTNITDFMGGSRGQDPFSGFIRHQEEKIVLLSTGGTLTSLAQADTGTLAGGAQMEVWREIVAKDAVAIEGAIKRALVIPFIEKKFPGQPIAVDFGFDRTKKLTAKESADVAVSLKNAGYLVDQSELEQATGFTLLREETAPQPVGYGGQALAKAKAAEKKPGNALATALQDAFEAAIGEAMAEELEGKSEEEAKAKEGHCTSPKGPAGCTSESCPGAKDLSNLKDDQGDGLDEARKESLKRGQKSIETALATEQDVMNAMTDPELGSIDFRWDANGFGIKHIIERRNAFKNAGHPDSISGEDMVRMLPSVISRGEKKFVGKGLRRDVEIDFKGLHVVLTPSLRGKPTNHWVMTGYDINPEAAGYRK